jgi:hypothetical protein
MDAMKQNREKSRKDSASTMKGVMAILDKTPKIIEINPNIIKTFTTFFIKSPILN